MILGLCDDCFNGSTFSHLIPQMALYYSLLVATTLRAAMQNLNQTFPKWLLVLFQFLYGFVVFCCYLCFIPTSSTYYLKIKLTVPLPYFLDLQISAGLFIYVDMPIGN
jgi:hypothetical protein